ncbi:MAG: signal peptidase I [Candidatus Berkelbacteria bacterium]
MGKFRKILAIIGNVILMILIIIGVFVGVTLLPIKNNFKLLAVTSGSMEPTIHTGSLAIIKSASEYKVGDIITFKKADSTSDKETTTHRIFSTSNVGGVEYIETKGDANKTPDMSKITKNQIVGKYRFSVALLGYLLKYLKTLPGLILIIVIPAVIIVYEEVKKIARESKEIIAKKRLNKSPKKEKK